MKKLLLSFLMMAAAAVAYAQQLDTLMGQIVDNKGRGMKRLEVSLASDPATRKTTDREGYFRFTDISLQDTVFFVFKKQKYSIPVEGRKGIRIHALQGETVAKEDLALVDMGYGYIEQKDRLQPGTTITGDDLRRGGYTSIYDALRVYVPGLSVTTTDLSGSSASVGGLRGQTSITGSQSPLFLVDGMIVEDLSLVSIQDVVSIEIMKDASIYGSRGANGAILVSTVMGANRVIENEKTLFTPKKKE